MNYADLSAALTVLAEQAQTPYTVLPPDFVTWLPRAIDYGEGRIYRDFVFLATRAQDASLSFSAGMRTLPLAGMQTVIIVPEGLAMILPQGAQPAAGTRYAFDRADLDTIDLVWPQEDITVSPSATSERFWALRDNQTIVASPTPDGNYTAEITGLFRPAPISAGNPSTYLSTVYPELLVAACMISVAGYMRDYGQQADDPKLAMSWEMSYQTLKMGVEAEEMRRRAAGSGWSQDAKVPLAERAAVGARPGSE